MTSFETDEQYMLERAAWYRERPKIDLRHFKFENDRTHDVRTVNSKNVNNLVQIFKLKDCFRLKSKHYVSVLISKNFLKEILRESEKRFSDLMRDEKSSHFSLVNDISLTVLHDQHRLLAEKEFLWDKW